MSNPSIPDDVRSSGPGLPTPEDIRGRHAQLAEVADDDVPGTVRRSVYLNDVEALLWHLDRYRLLFAKINETLAVGEHESNERAADLSQGLHIAAAALTRPTVLPGAVTLAATFRRAADMLRAAVRREAHLGQAWMVLGEAAAALAELEDALPEEVHEQARQALDVTEQWLADAYHRPPT